MLDGDADHGQRPAQHQEERDGAQDRRRLPRVSAPAPQPTEDDEAVAVRAERRRPPPEWDLFRLRNAMAALARRDQHPPPGALHEHTVGVPVSVAVSIRVADAVGMTVAVRMSALGAIGHHPGAWQAEDPAGWEGVPVRGDDHGRAGGRCFLEQSHDDRSVLFVQRCQRLVSEQNPWPGDQSSGDRDTLPFTRGQLMRIRAAPRGEVHRLQRRERALFDGRVRNLGVVHLQRQHDVLQRCQAGQQPLLLEDERHVAPQVSETAPPPAVQASSSHPQLARARPELAVDQAKQRRLARATGPGDLDQLAWRDRKVHTFEHQVAAVRLVEGDELDRGLDRRRAGGARTAPGGAVLLFSV